MNTEISILAFESLLKSIGHKFPKLSILSNKSGNLKKHFPLLVKTNTDIQGIAILDITLDEDKKIRLIEANGSNGNLTSTSLGNDNLRVEHIYSIVKDKISKQIENTVLLFPYKDGFMHLAEFYSRIYCLAKLISKDKTTGIRDCSEPYGEESVVIICGTVEEIASNISLRNSELYFKNLKVIFSSNPNLLPELARIGKFSKKELYTQSLSEIFHDGPLLKITHDKYKQQKVAQGTGIEPLYSEEVWDKQKCIKAINKINQKGSTAVAKINAGSGGAGIDFFPIELSSIEIEQKLELILHDAEKHYGNNYASTIFPIRLFEFVKSTPFSINNLPHLWDMRMECLIYPGYTLVLPCLIRICPAPFSDNSYSKDQVVSNLTGRAPSLEFIRSALDEEALNNIGITLNKLTEMSMASAMWCQSAWNSA